MWQERFFHGKKQIGRSRPDEQILSGVALSQVVRVEMRKYMNFEELNLDPKIMRAVTEMGFEQASPIQAKSIPIAMEGKDMIGQAQTGTGKTAAFGIPVLQRVDPHKKNCKQSFFVRQESLLSSLQMRFVS